MSYRNANVMLVPLDKQQFAVSTTVSELWAHGTVTLSQIERQTLDCAGAQWNDYRGDGDMRSGVLPKTGRSTVTMPLGQQC
jgi:hypothetical protein